MLSLGPAASLKHRQLCSSRKRFSRHKVLSADPGGHRQAHGYCRELQPRLATDVIVPHLRTVREFKNKYKYKNPSPYSPPWGRGSPPFTVGETARAPRGDQAAAAADWASWPAAQPIRCLGSRAIHESIARLWYGKRQLWRIPVVPQSATWPSFLAW